MALCAVACNTPEINEVKSRAYWGLNNWYNQSRHDAYGEDRFSDATVQQGRLANLYS